MTKAEKTTIIEAWTAAWIDLKAAQYRVVVTECERGCGYSLACSIVHNNDTVRRYLSRWVAINELCERLAIDTPFCERASDLQTRFWRYAEGINPDE